MKRMYPYGVGMWKNGDQGHVCESAHKTRYEWVEN